MPCKLGGPCHLENVHQPNPAHPYCPAAQLERGYAVKDEASMQFSPTPLGEALISAYRKMG